jgi:hypothetical protein
MAETESPLLGAAILTTVAQAVNLFHLSPATLRPARIAVDWIESHRYTLFYFEHDVSGPYNSNCDRWVAVGRCCRSRGGLLAVSRMRVRSSNAPICAKAYKEHPNSVVFS